MWFRGGKGGNEQRIQWCILKVFERGQYQGKLNRVGCRGVFSNVLRNDTSPFSNSVSALTVGYPLPSESRDKDEDQMCVCKLYFLSFWKHDLCRELGILACAQLKWFCFLHDNPYSVETLRIRRTQHTHNPYGYSKTFSLVAETESKQISKSLLLQTIVLKTWVLYVLYSALFVFCHFSYKN